MLWEKTKHLVRAWRATCSGRTAYWSPRTVSAMVQTAEERRYGCCRSLVLAHLALSKVDFMQAVFSVFGLLESWPQELWENRFVEIPGLHQSGIYPRPSSSLDQATLVLRCASVST